MVESFHFLRPWFIIVLPFIAIIIWKLTAGVTQTNPWHNQVSAHLKKFMIGGQENKSHTGRRQHILLSLLLGLLLIALLGPTMWKKQATGVAVKPQVLILLDQSLSMLADDVKPSRTARANHLILNLLEKLPDSAVGLIAYAGTEHPLVPITFTHDIIQQAVNNIDPKLMPKQGNNALPALAASTASLAGLPKSTLIWITDDIKKDDEKDIIQYLKASRFETIIIGIGTKKGAPINLGNGSLLRDKKGQLVIPFFDTAHMQTIAQKAGSRYYNHKTLYGDNIKAITQPINSAAIQNTDQPPEDTLQDLGYDRWEDIGPWLLLPAALLFASLFRRGFLFVIPLLFINPILTLDAQAQRPDQKAWEAYQSADYKAATQLSEDPLITGAAYYKQKDYTKAAQAFAKATETYSEGSQKAIQAYYNLGNALAQTQQFEAAIGAYNQALAWQKDHTDAQFNRDLLEQLKQEQEQEQNNQQQNNNQKQNDNASNQQKTDTNTQQNTNTPQDTNTQQNTNDETEAQQQALQKALDHFKKQEQAQEQAQINNKDETSDETPKDNQHTQTIEQLDQPQRGPQVENHHLEAMELQPHGVLRNKMIRQYQQQRGPSDDETW